MQILSWGTQSAAFTCSGPDIDDDDTLSPDEDFTEEDDEDEDLEPDDEDELEEEDE